MYKKSSQNEQRRRETMPLRALVRPDSSPISQEELRTNLISIIKIKREHAKHAPHGPAKDKLTREVSALDLRIKQLSTKPKKLDLSNYFIDAAEEVLPKERFSSLMRKANEAFNTERPTEDHISSQKKALAEREALTDRFKALKEILTETKNERQNDGERTKLVREYDAIAQKLRATPKIGKTEYSLARYFIEAAKDQLTHPEFKIILARARQKAQTENAPKPQCE